MESKLTNPSPTNKFLSALKSLKILQVRVKLAMAELRQKEKTNAERVLRE